MKHPSESLYGFVFCLSFAAAAAADLIVSPAAVSEHQLAPGTPGSCSLVGREGPGAGSASESGGDEGGEALRREWEALLEAAARCKDAQQQPQMLARCSRVGLVGGLVVVMLVWWAKQQCCTGRAAIRPLYA
jgi:hypothetical protein